MSRVVRAIDLHYQDPAACSRLTRREADAVVKVWMDGDRIVFALTTPTASVSIAEAGDALLAIATKIARDGL